MAAEIECTLDDVANALRYLDESDMDLWVRMGMAIKGEFGEGGFDVWDSWSQGYSKYKQKEAVARWKSFKISGARGTVTIGSLFHLAKNKGFEFTKKEFTQEEKIQFAREVEARRAARESDIAIEEAASLVWYGVVADAANALVPQLKTIGSSPYLGKKRVGAYGIYFAPHSFVIRTNENFTVDIFSGALQTKEFFEKKKENKNNDTDLSFFYFKKGSILIPLRDMNGELKNFQIIFTDGQKKRFLKEGRKSGYFHVIGNFQDEEMPIVFCEGYATGASIHMATQWPVVVCFDSGNLPVVAEQFKNHSQLKIIAGDNDWETAQEENKKNTGLEKAKQAAAICGGVWCVPNFAGHVHSAEGLSDFNDLHVAVGLSVVREQLYIAVMQTPAENYIENDLNVIDDGYADYSPAFDDVPVTAYEDYTQGDVSSSQTPAPSDYVKPTLETMVKRYALAMPDGKIWDSLQKKVIKKTAFQLSIGKKLFDEWIAHDERREVNLDDVQHEAAKAQTKGAGGLAKAIERYIYLNPSSMSWDCVTRKQVSLSDLRYAIADCFDQWVKHPERKQLPKENLVFDPTQTVSTVTHINMFRGLPLKPEANDDGCRNIRHMLWCLCNKQDEIFVWVCKWLAYPLQHVGAKMQSAVLMHSDVHGSGKSYFFDGVMREIYGEYCRTFGQAELESQYNDWISQTLFGVFEEVLSRSQRYSHTGTLKQMITGTKVRINQKYMQGWEESNHMNCVFLSNEVQPLPVEPSDRRFLVVWPESKLLDELKIGVDVELKAGGAVAFYDWLLRVDTTGFTAYTEPPSTDAKRRLIDIGRPAWEVFYDDWLAGRLDVPYCSCLVRDLFKIYVHWCNQRRESMVSMNRFSGYIGSKERKRPDLHYEFNSYRGKGNFFIIGKPPHGKTQAEWLGGCVGEFDRHITNIEMAVAS